MRLPFRSNRLSSCVFCRIVEGKEPNEIMYKDDKYTAFSDIRPASENHILIITNNHVEDITCLQGKTDVVDELVSVANQLLEKKGADLNDVRMGFHVPPLISVPHIHLHVIWPYGRVKMFVKWKYKRSTWFWTPEVAKRWLLDREEREAAARGPDDRDRRRKAAQKKQSAAAEAKLEDVAAEAEGGEDKDVADVTKKMAKMNN